MDQQHEIHYIKKGRKIIYYLKVLKKYGAPVHDMLQFYCSVIRLSLEYGDVLWHGSLTNAQSADLERIQKRALRIICPKMDYNEALAHFRMSTLKERCEKHCVELIRKMSSEGHRSFLLDLMKTNTINLNIGQNVLERVYAINSYNNSF
jgi:hypothetical protein